MLYSHASSIKLTSGRAGNFWLSGEAWTGIPVFDGTSHSSHENWSYNFDYQSSPHEDFGFFLVLSGKDSSATFHVGNLETDRKSHLLFSSFLKHKHWLIKHGPLCRFHEPGFLKQDWNAFSGPFPLGISLVDVSGGYISSRIESDFADLAMSSFSVVVPEIKITQVTIQLGVNRGSKILFEKQFGEAPPRTRPTTDYTTDED